MSRWEPISSTQVSAAHQEYLRGATLAELGAQLGVGRERVRQLFVKAGLPTRSTREAGALRRLATGQAIEARRDEIIALYKERGNILAVARRIGLPHRYVAEVIHSLPDELAYRRNGAEHRQYSDAELLHALHRARDHLGCERLGQMAYRRAAADLRLPDLLTILHRFGSWPQAMEAAKLPYHPALGRRSTSLTREDCLAAVVECVRENGGGWVSTGKYETWARAREKPSLPSVRNIVGKWREVMPLAIDIASKDAVY